MTLLSQVSADLHAHSRRSDGTEAPAGLVAAAREAGVDVVAITDHDTIEGWAEAREAAQAIGMGLVPGIEVSTRQFGFSVHILCYLPNPDFAPLFAELDRVRESRLTRAKRTVERINEDFPLPWDEVMAKAPEGATIGRPHIADALIDRGYAHDRGEAFERILRLDRGYVASYYAPDPHDAIRLIRDAGGVPVLAHPAANPQGRTPSRQVLADLRDAGLFGVELNHPENFQNGIDRLTPIVQDLGLAITGGGDWHGTGKVNRIGDGRTSGEVLERLLAEATGTDWVPPQR